MNGKLSIFITASDNHFLVTNFIKSIMEAKPKQIQGVAIIPDPRRIPDISPRNKKKSSRSVVLQTGKDLIMYFLILGILHTIIYGVRWGFFRFSRKFFSLLGRTPGWSIERAAQRFQIPVWCFASVNDGKLIELLERMKPDVIINQAPGIVKKPFLSIPKIGVLNRHNALLPKNRGRFSPFWALYKGEKVTGVSIHFIVEALDAGPIICQRSIEVAPHESVPSLIKKCYALATNLVLEALDILEKGDPILIPNNDSEATYNSNPTLSQAWELRRRIFKARFKRFISF